MIFQAFIVFEFVSVIRLIPSWKELNEKRINVLYAGNLIACLIYSLALIYIFWFKRQKFVDIVNQLQNETIFADPKKKPNLWNAVKVLKQYTFILKQFIRMSCKLIFEFCLFVKNNAFVGQLNLK